MNTNRECVQSDLWANWLLRERFAGDPAHERAFRADISRYADRVLDGARLEAGMTLVDVGAGDGLVAFRAIDRIGPSLHTVLVDISAALLQHAEATATQCGIRGQCTFTQCSAEALEGIGDASVDAVTTRAVLAYLPDKRAVLREFYRVVKPGGRISIAEPICRDDALDVVALKKSVDALPAGTDDHISRLLYRWKITHLPGTEEDIAANPITNYSERDLVRYAMDAGFTDIHMEFHIDVGPSPTTSWDVLLKNPPFPWAPPLGELLRNTFTKDEGKRIEQALRPLLTSGQQSFSIRTAFLSATKPLAS
ncbi:class I SAM-dependent methyltransferase [Paraburkholderia sp. B3]|uniref:class I SAM-dependent methyltransferase n=1 Tax=Paraburkholderia sp. B3 TaxID=3134791 RepID=UPI003982675A